MFWEKRWWDLSWIMSWGEHQRGGEAPGRSSAGWVPTPSGSWRFAVGAGLQHRRWMHWLLIMDLPSQREGPSLGSCELAKQPQEIQRRQHHKSWLNLWGSHESWWPSSGNHQGHDLQVQDAGPQGQGADAGPRSSVGAWAEDVCRMRCRFTHFVCVFSPWSLYLILRNDY